MEEIHVPPYFLCPISLEIMKDPVIVSTGISYDRESIERWIFTCKNTTCPVTKQVISDSDLTPNHILRRFIQAWCTLNASYGIERIPTPKPPIDKTQIVKLINEAKIPHLQMKSLRKLKSIASESERNHRCMEAAGAIEFLASVIENDNHLIFEGSSDEGGGGGLEFTRPSDEALIILNNIRLSEQSLKHLFTQNGEFIDSLTRVLQRENSQSRAYAVMLLKSMFEVADPIHLMRLKPPHFFIEVVSVLRDQISNQASKASLKLLMEVCPWGRNRIKAVDAGAVSVLIEVLIEKSEKRSCEMMLVLLDQLCGCAEGRAQLLKHGGGLAVVSKKILRVSQVASQRAVRILALISKFSATTSVLHEMLQVGVVSKLCLVLQMDCGFKTKEKAREILRLHSRVWKNSPCIPTHLVSSYPS